MTIHDDPIASAPDIKTHPGGKEDASESDRAELLYTLVQSALWALQKTADRTAAKNYVSLGFNGLVAPFDRAEIHIFRPGGQTPVERATELEAENKRLSEMVHNLSVANTDIAIELVSRITDASPIETDERFNMFVRSMESTAAVLREEVLKLRGETP